ncbi:5-oxoprolinase-like [Clavelina lepadiformis]|uniref:5-oxoprolinase-like n=1 Tax=Clavelina lepadiformis TaxID=159417 RepID=UPI0040437B76
MSSKGKFQFAIDRGGTFTDIYAKCPNGKTRVMKLLSVDPQNYPDAPREGIRRIMEEELNIKMNEPLDSSQIDFIRMGTTVATNALLERKGERMALAVTEGLRDLLFIGNQSRPKIFDFKIEIPDVLYEEVVEVRERVCLHRNDCQLGLNSETRVGQTLEKVHVLTTLDVEKLKIDLKKVLEKGITSLAVVLMHSYTFTEHEEAVQKIAMEMGFKQVSLSSEVMPMVKIVPRGFTVCVDAYLTPCIKDYITGFQSGFSSRDINALFMQSDGGLTPIDKFNGSRAILSGPAGGVVGYAMTSFEDQPVIGFDMGGTSTDVSRYDGEYEHVFESTTAGVTIQAPQLDINTVAAGGGSMLFFRSGMFVVGPESAGAHPGPTCYRKGGPLTVTDANLCLGRLLPEYFPKIFGPGENQCLDVDGTRKAFEKLRDKINYFISSETTDRDLLTLEEVAMGFINVANESMCRPIRSLTQVRGHDTRRHVLSCFGGAGGQHACAIARSLGMTKVFIHKYSGILSAYGMALADVIHEAQRPTASLYNKETIPTLDVIIDELIAECVQALSDQGFSPENIKTDVYLNMRYVKTGCALMCQPSTVKNLDFFATKFGDFLQTFQARYKKEFGFTIPGRDIIVDDVRVRGIGLSGIEDHALVAPSDKPPRVEKVVSSYFDGGHLDTRVHLMEDLLSGHVIHGPAIIIDKNSTILVEPDCKAEMTKKGDITIMIGKGKPKHIGKELDAIQLSIFSHRFMSIAEQMGRILQRTAISTNIKERLDFSCALFGPDGGLVSNAPHIPGHLGAMQDAVQYQMRAIEINEGDCILSNHPSAGGVHLPDLTVITPVFIPEHTKPIFFVANRGHHADVGGIMPGSMPSNSTSINDEGAVFKSFKLVKDGIFQENDVTAVLLSPRKFPGCSGTRNLHDNLADLRAQVAANQKGIHLVQELISSYGLEVVQAYMAHIQHHAEVAVRNLLREVSMTTDGVLSASDKMDDGSVINLRVEIDSQEGSATFDFEGTSPMVINNLNAPRAITKSAIIYSLRCMVGYDIPLNQGCLAPIHLQIPKWSILDPDDDAAVVGGNVLTSQRIVDVIMKLFKACAASQGCMNNTTFGDDSFGYYDTVAGGAGAGPTWHGRSGVHTHMTNTRSTDPEIFEKRYPVLLKSFRLLPGTGGEGRYKGGDGVLREILFRKNLTLSVLSERRVFQPYGADGGGPGSRGENLLLRHKGPIVNLGAKNFVVVNPGDIFHLKSPGGGGYGAPSSDDQSSLCKHR